MNRAYNFSAGPATLPKTVLLQAQEEILNWRGTNVSVMEMSHRGKDFGQIYEKTQNDFRELLSIPKEYLILFTQGGARALNALIPMNLLGRCKQNPLIANYIITGTWSEISAKEAEKYTKVNVIANTKTTNFTQLPILDKLQYDDDHIAYTHICSNETIHGVQFQSNDWPTSCKFDAKEFILVADMSSDLLTRKLDVTKFGVIYAGAQKNIGIAGLSVLIVREDLLDYALPNTPSVFNWENMARHNSLYNTPPTYAIYITGLILQWLKAQGGLSAIERQNYAKAALLYDTIDNGNFYYNHVQDYARSKTNIPFFLKNKALENIFLDGAIKNNLLNLKGHSSIGGMRASCYNAMPLAGVQLLVEYMNDFKAKFNH